MRRSGGDELEPARRAIARARTRLQRDVAPASLLADGLDDVEEVVEALAAIAKRDTIAEARARRVLDWRDRLSSYLLAAHALDDINVDGGAGVSLLARGVRMIDTEMTADAPAEQVPSSA